MNSLRVPSARLIRLHAVSVSDFIAELQRSDFEIIQFSGHGSTAGVYLEASNIDESEEVSARRVASILRGASSRLKAAIFVSCFSTSAISDLIDVAPYLITVSGSAEDDSAIEFIRRFYEAYFKHNSIEIAFETAVRLVGAILERKGIHPVLSRRAKEKGAGRFLIQAFPVSRDSILVDLTDAEKDLAKVNVSRDEFLSLLTRKIRGHQWVFDIPRERVILPIGSYFGVFSWKDVNDVVYCTKVLQVKEDIEEQACKVWVKLVMRYNDLFSSRYRTLIRPSDPIHQNLLNDALRDLGVFIRDFLEDESVSEVLRLYSGRHYKASSALIESNLTLSLAKYGQGDFSSVILYLESALSAIHDLVDSLTERLCE